MSHFRLARISLILAALGMNAALGVSAVHAAEKEPAAEAPKDTVRPEMFKLIDPNQIKELNAAKNYAEVTNRINQAAALPNLTPFENFILVQMRAQVASATGNMLAMAAAMGELVDSGRLSGDVKLSYIQEVGNIYYNNKDFDKAVTWFKRYSAEGGDQRQRPYVARAYFFKGDLETAKTELRKDLDAHRAAGSAPSSGELTLLANIGNNAKDKATYLEAIELLVKYYPSDAYWTDLLSRTRGKPSYSPRFDLDILRLKKVAIAKMDGDDYFDLADIALLGGFYTEAKKALDIGYEAGLLGTGTDAAKHKKLRDQANKGAADDAKNIGAGEAPALKSKDGIGLVNLGYVYVTMDQFDKGLELMEKGIAKGIAKNPEDAKLRLGYAYALAGRKEQANKILETIQGADGRADLARYWLIWNNRASTAVAPAAAAAK